MVIDMQVITKQIADLVFATYNPRRELTPADPEFVQIRDSIKRFGLVTPIVINSDNTVIAGHQRLSVLEHLGMTEVACVVLDLDKQSEKALNVALNKISGVWDLEKLDAVLKDLADYDAPEVTGFGLDEIKQLDLAGLESNMDSIFDVSKDRPASHGRRVKELCCPHCKGSFKADESEI